MLVIFPRGVQSGVSVGVLPLSETKEWLALLTRRLLVIVPNHGLTFRGPLSVSSRLWRKPQGHAKKVRNIQFLRDVQVIHRIALDVGRVVATEMF